MRTISFFNIFLLFSLWWSIPFGLVVLIGGDNSEAMKTLAFIVAVATIATGSVTSGVSKRDAKHYRGLAGLAAFFITGFVSITVEAPLETLSGISFSGGESIFSRVFAAAAVINIIVAVSLVVADFRKK